MGAAPTGSGKTACFCLGILQHLAADPYGIYALILTPTRYCYHSVKVIVLLSSTTTATNTTITTSTSL